MQHFEIAHQYCKDVISGTIPACVFVKYACERQLQDLEKQNTDDFPYYFDEKSANSICDFLETLPHVKGEWARRRETTKLEAWQKFVLSTTFGWKRSGTDLRRFRTSYVEVPRKNGKSFISAGVGLYMITEDGEIGSEVYSAATKKDQARIVFDVARQMVRREKDMQNYYSIQPRAHSIIGDVTDSKFEPLSADYSSLDGLNVHCGIIDELHAHKTRDVFDVIETATGSRSQPLLWNITTAGSNQEGICYEQRIYVTKILNGRIKDETYFGIIYTIDKEDNWMDESSWIKANPNYGVSVYPHVIKSAYDKAQETPSAVNNFLTKRLNVWVNAAEAWLDIRKWDECADEDLKLEDFEGESCYVSVDLSSKKDIAAKVYLFPPEQQEDLWLVFWKLYLPELAIKTSSNSQYEGWAKTGNLIPTSGNTIDFDLIEEGIKQDFKKFKVKEFIYDPFQATQLVNHIAEHLGPYKAEKQIVEIGATVKNFSEPMKEVEALIISEQFIHNGCPVFGWMMSNVVAHLDAKDNIFPRKETFDSKIDGPVALIMAMNRALANKKTTSKYEDKPLRVL